MGKIKKGEHQLIFENPILKIKYTDKEWDENFIRWKHKNETPKQEIIINIMIIILLLLTFGVGTGYYMIAGILFFLVLSSIIFITIIIPLYKNMKFSKSEHIVCISNFGVAIGTWRFYSFMSNRLYLRNMRIKGMMLVINYSDVLSKVSEKECKRLEIPLIDISEEQINNAIALMKYETGIEVVNN